MKQAEQAFQATSGALQVRVLLQQLLIMNYQEDAVVLSRLSMHLVVWSCEGVHITHHTSGSAQLPPKSVGAVTVISASW
jgi:hypothetical protein